MELCGACYAADSQKHRGHEIGQLMIQRVTDMPDDREVQLKAWWRCSFPGCNLGSFLAPKLVILGGLADECSHWTFSRMATQTY